MLENTPPKKNRLVVRCSDHDHYIDYSDIICIEASESQAFIHTRKDSIHGSKVVVCKPLKNIEDLLPSSHFIRVHKSWMVHLTYVCKHKKGEVHSLVMTGNLEVPIASRKLKEVISAIEDHNNLR